MYTQLEKLASAIRNDVVGGLRGYHTNMSMSIEQLMDEIVETRLQIILKYVSEGIILPKDLYTSLNCLEIKCENIEKCRCNKEIEGTPTAWFEIPQVVNIFGNMLISYVGTIDRESSFPWYTSLTTLKQSKYKKRGHSKPKVYIDPSPNERGMLDCFVFDAPMLQNISITAIFKDPRQVEDSGCGSCTENLISSVLDSDIKQRLTQQKIQYYRQLAPPIIPNNQEYAAG